MRELERQSIRIIREAHALYRPSAFLWSIGKDSTVLLWLIRKAFLGDVPMPLIHIDTSYKIPEMIAYRDRLAREWGLNLIVEKNSIALERGMSPTSAGRVECCGVLKTAPFREVVRRNGFKAIFLGIRRDEEASRSKERVFSPRNAQFEWDFRNQPPEVWGLTPSTYPKDAHVRVHPLLDWTELNVWQYIEQEKIPVIDLYFTKKAADGGESPRRYRSIGCAPCTGTIASSAATPEEIITELSRMLTDERASRAQDQERRFAMQSLREKGYM